MDRKRKIALGFATLAVALGAGHMVQRDRGDTRRAAQAQTAPTGITPLAATAEPHPLRPSPGRYRTCPGKQSAAAASQVKAPRRFSVFAASVPAIKAPATKAPPRHRMPRSPPR
ncbi:MAG: hypothetical protein U5N10_09385 [Gemmobacter sp.]|nr:hypothetical protein [Gemmobacter sp.]